MKAFNEGTNSETLYDNGAYQVRITQDGWFEVVQVSSEVVVSLIGNLTPMGYRTAKNQADTRAQEEK